MATEEGRAGDGRSANANKCTNKGVVENAAGWGAANGFVREGGVSVKREKRLRERWSEQKRQESVLRERWAIAWSIFCPNFQLHEDVFKAQQQFHDLHRDAPSVKRKKGGKTFSAASLHLKQRQLLKLKLLWKNEVTLELSILFWLTWSRIHGKAPFVALKFSLNLS